MGLGYIFNFVYLYRLTFTFKSFIGPAIVDNLIKNIKLLG